MLTLPVIVLHTCLICFLLPSHNTSGWVSHKEKIIIFAHGYGGPRSRSCLW